MSFPGPELLGRPTSHSVTINVVASAAIDAYFQYGTQPGQYSGQTSTASSPANEPLVVVLSGLQSDIRYYYRMMYRPAGTSTWIPRTEHSFRTQRAPGSTFSFTVVSDSHINIVFGNPSLYQRTLQNVAADNPDFHLDLGDTFAMDNVTTQTQANSAYLSQRAYMGLVSHSAPIFLVLGNHEEEEGWHLDDTGNALTSQPTLGANARKRYYLNPNPLLDSFYTGNTDTTSPIAGDRLPEDYYAWEWGDALFVVIDPYRYTTTKPFTGNMGGGESSDPGTGDRWAWTLGFTQYQWLKQTLENSRAAYKFVFAHHVAGGTEDYSRGGANAVPYVEWGGYNEDGVTWGFDVRRPGWAMPIHQLLVQNRVTAFFHGHDHEFAHEKRDGVVYQLVPMPSDASYGYGSFQLYHETDPYTIRVLPNSGHLRVTVSPSQATVDYIRAFLSGAGTNAQVAYTYSMSPATSTDGTPPAISSVSAAAGSGGTATVTWATDEDSDSRVAYGPSVSLGLSAGSATLVKSHSVALNGLAPGTVYYYQVTSRDAAGNVSTSPATPASFTTPAATRVTAFPSSTVVQSGTLRSGGAASLTADDNVYFQINSTAFGTRRTAAYAAFTGVPNSLANLKISFKGKNSASCTQSASVWRWTTSSWVQLDSRTVGTTEVAISNLAPGGTLADYVSGTSGNGELRVRVQCTRSTSFYASWDLMSVSYDRP